MPTAAACARRWLTRLAVSYLVCFSLLANAHAQHQAAPGTQTPTAALTLTDCLRIGIARQPAVAAQRASLGAAEAQRKSLDGMVCMSLISSELPIRKQQACVGVTIAEAGVQIAEWEALYAVSRCYFTVVFAKKQEAVAKGLLEKLELARKNAIGLVKGGDVNNVVTQIDVDKLTVNIDLMELRLVEASTGIQRAMAALREAMGLRYDSPLPLVLEDFPNIGENLDRESLIRLALARRGEIVQATFAAQLAELEVCAQNTGCLLPFKFSFASSADVHSRQIPQGMSNGTYRPGAIGLEMPVALVGRKADRVERARELSSRAAAVVEKTNNLVALEAEDAFYTWQATSAQVKTLRESAVKSAKLADLISGRFDNGKVSGEDYLRARTLEDQTQAQLNETLFRHALALAALERVTAGGFTPSYRRLPPAP